MRTRWRPKRMTGECSTAPCSVLPLIFLTLWVSLCGSAHQGKPWRHHPVLNTIACLRCQYAHAGVFMCTCVVMCPCGHVAMWPCGHVAMWPCGHVPLCLRGRVAASLLLHACTSQCLLGLRICMLLHQCALPLCPLVPVCTCPYLPLSSQHRCSYFKLRACLGKTQTFPIPQ